MTSLGRTSFRLSSIARGAILATVVVAAATSGLFRATPHLGAAAAQATTSRSATQNAVPTDFRDFVEWAAADISTYWEGVYGAGGTFVRPQVQFFTEPVLSPCDTRPTTPAEGPFYCDNVVYVPDAWFAADPIRMNDFAIAYVLAHEIGHDVQDTQGILASLNAGIITSVETELQADCLAGVWAANANARGMLDDTDFQEGTALATTIGDDYLGFTPDQYTHGTSAQRVAWLTYGYEIADGSQCSTY